MPQTVVLVRSGYVLNNFAVRSVVKNCGALDGYASEAGVPVESLLQQWTSYIPLPVNRYDSEHHFGPTLGIVGGDGASIEITIPWGEVIGVIVGQTGGRMPTLGFAPPSK